jgi:hypothetical protein
MQFDEAAGRTGAKSASFLVVFCRLVPFFWSAVHRRPGALALPVFRLKTPPVGEQSWTTWSFLVSSGVGEKLRSSFRHEYDLRLSEASARLTAENARLQSERDSVVSLFASTHIAGFQPEDTRGT